MTTTHVRYVWLLAYLLYYRKLCVVDGVTLMSHAQVSAKWHEITHTDPCSQDGKSGYMATYGKTWADFWQILQPKPGSYFMGSKFKARLQ